MRFIRLKNARVFGPGFSRHESSAFSPEGARHIGPGQVRRQPPNAALGVVVRRARSPDRARRAVVDHGLLPWAGYGCFALSGLPIHASGYPGRRFACPGLICRRPFGAQGRASFSRMNQREDNGYMFLVSSLISRLSSLISYLLAVLDPPGGPAILIGGKEIAMTPVAFGPLALMVLLGLGGGLGLPLGIPPQKEDTALGAGGPGGVSVLPELVRDSGTRPQERQSDRTASGRAGDRGAA